MSITYPLTPPSGHHTAQKTKLSAWTTNAIAASPYTGSQQVFQWPGEGWKVDVSLRPMKMQDAEYWVSFLLALRGNAGTFLWGDTARKTPQGIATGTPKVNSTAGGITLKSFLAHLTASLALSVAIGDTVVIFANGTGSGSVGVSDDGSSGGNVYVRLGSELVNAGKGDCYICLSATKTATTITAAGSGMTGLSICGGTFSGVIGYGGFTNVGGTSASASSSVTTTRDNSVVVSGVQVLGDSTLTTTSGTQQALSALGGAACIEAIITTVAPTSGTVVTTSETFASAAWQQWSLELLGAPPTNAAGNEVLITDGWTASQAGIVKAGDYLQLQASGAPQRLYKVLADANSDGSGNATFDIFPRIRETIPDNTAIVTATARGTFRLLNNQQDWDIDEALVYGIEFQAVEAL